MGILVALTTNSGKSEWAAMSWDPKNEQWLLYASHNACSLDKIYECTQAPSKYKYDRTWKSTGAKEGKNYIIFTIERPFENESSDRVLKVGDIRQMKTGFVVGAWKTYGFSDYMQVCLTKAGDPVQCGKSDSFEIKEPDLTPVTEPTQPQRPTDVMSNEWVGIVDGECQGNDEKCFGVNYRGKYVVETDAQGEHHLTVTGTMSWQGEERNRDKAFGLFIALSRKNGMSEWSAQNWDPNPPEQWRVYSSINNCPVTSMPVCALEWRTFYFDKSWKQDQIKEKKNELYFSTSRPFNHKTPDRQLKIGETRQLRAGFLIGTWAKGNWGFSPTFTICLSDDGDCGQWEDQNTNAAGESNDWVALDAEKCTGYSKCAGYEQKGSYKVQTDSNGQSKLKIDGEVQWKRRRQPRDRNKRFGIFTIMQTGNAQTEWSANSWDPDREAWNFFSSYNQCPLSDVENCAKDIERFEFDTTWRKNSLTEGPRSIKFSTERDFRHTVGSRALKLGDTRLFKSGFVQGEWDQYGYSDPIKIVLADSANEVDLQGWEPPSEDEFFEQEWDEDGHPIVSDEEWEDWEEENLEAVEKEDEVVLEGINDDEWEEWEDDEDTWMSEER